MAQLMPASTTWIVAPNQSELATPKTDLDDISEVDIDDSGELSTILEFERVLSYSAQGNTRYVSKQRALYVPIEVTQALRVAKLQVLLDIEHAHPSDLILRLADPTGRSITLIHRLVDLGANFSQTILDDQADSPIDEALAPFKGQFQPQTRLSWFDGVQAQGTWHLIVIDLSRDHFIGKVNHVSLQIHGKASTEAPSGSTSSPEDRR